MESEPRSRRRPSLMSVPVVTTAADVRSELTGRFLTDSPLAEFANVVLGLAVVALGVGLYPLSMLALWFGALVVTSAIRYRIRAHYAKKTEPPAEVPWPVLVAI